MTKVSAYTGKGGRVAGRPEGLLGVAGRPEGLSGVAGRLVDQGGQGG